MQLDEKAWLQAFRILSGGRGVSDRPCSLV
jgi:hypothetical protein